MVDQLALFEFLVYLAAALAVCAAIVGVVEAGPADHDR